MNELSAILPASPSALPEKWIDKLFERLEALYGARFHDAWRGVDLANVKRTWAEKLADFASMPDCLKSALDACDEKPWPPTLPEFLALCRDAARRKGTSSYLLLEEKLTPAQIARAERAAVLAQQALAATTDARAWAHRLRARQLAGEVLGNHQHRMLVGMLPETETKPAGGLPATETEEYAHEF